MPQKYTKKVSRVTAKSRVYNQIQIKHEVVLWLYLEIFTYLRDSAYAVSHTGFFNHFMIDTFTRVAGRILRNSAIIESDTSLENRGHKGTARHPAYRVLTLTAGHEFLYAAATGDNISDIFPSLYQHLPFVPAVYSILVKSFVRAVGNYCKLMDQMLCIREKMSHSHSRKASQQILHRLSRLERQLAQVEQRVGGDRATLYGIIQQVRYRMRLVVEMQTAISLAYGRLTQQIAERYGRAPMQIEDNFQHGTYGLLRAIEYFDPFKGKAISGIARWWIRAAILLTIKDEANLVRVPSGIWKQHEKLEEMAHQNGIAGDLISIAKLAGMTYDDVESIYKSVNVNRPSSLEDPISASPEGDGGRVGDKVPDPSPSPEEMMLENTGGMIPSLLNSLTADECRVVCCVYGLYNMYPPKEHNSSPDQILAERLRQVAIRTNIEHHNKGGS